jgi:endonuclease/exonuclease/phosphatase family metal-dependent hydrolase
MKLKILTYNIHKGFDWNNKTYQLENIKNLILKSGADIVCLQEVVGKSINNKKLGTIENQFEYLADKIWSNYSYGRNSVYDKGHHGNLILSKYPIDFIENINISTNSFEKRGLLVCKINHPHKDFLVGCLHLNLLHSGRKIQYLLIEDYIKRLLDGQTSSLILAGDFNDWNKKASLHFENTLGMIEVYKNQHGKYAKTFPAIYPTLSLDRIYVKNFTIKLAFTLNDYSTQLLSDHLPLFAEIEYYEK